MKSTSLLFWALWAGSTNSQVSETCLQETVTLSKENGLKVAQAILLEDYETSVKDICNFELSDLGCSIEFEGDTRTFEALCGSQGGQVYFLPVALSCLFGALDVDLGTIPTCVGGSCNVTNVRPSDVTSAQVDSFLNNLTFPGCNAESASVSRTAAGVLSYVMGSLSFWMLLSEL